MKLQHTSGRYIVSKLDCSQCGRQLNLSYDHGKELIKYTEEEPSGGYAVQSIIVVYPCECTTRPVEEAKSAVNALLRLCNGHAEG